MRFNTQTSLFFFFFFGFVLLTLLNTAYPSPDHIFEDINLNVWIYFLSLFWSIWRRVTNSSFMIWHARYPICVEWYIADSFEYYPIITSSQKLTSLKLLICFYSNIFSLFCTRNWKNSHHSNVIYLPNT